MFNLSGMFTMRRHKMKKVVYKDSNAETYAKDMNYKLEYR